MAVGADPNSPAALAALKAAGWTPAAYWAYVASQGGGGGGNFVSSGDPEVDAFDRALNGPIVETGGAPQFHIYRDNGRIVSLDTSTGKVEPLTSKGTGSGDGGSGVGWGQLQLQREQFDYNKSQDAAQRDFQQQQLNEQIRSNTNQTIAAQRKEIIDQYENAQTRLIQVQQLMDNAKMSRATLKEQARQFGVQQVMDQWKTAMSLIPQLGQLSLQESERVQSLLREGTDFTASAWERRGERSPLARVTQADQINAVKTSMNQLRDFMTSIPPVFIPEIDMPEGPNFGGGAGAGAMPPLPDFAGMGAPAGGAPAAPTAPAASAGPMHWSVGPDGKWSASPADPTTFSTAGGGGSAPAAPLEAPAATPTAAPAAAYVPNMTPPTLDVNAPGNGFDQPPMPAWPSADEALGASRGGTFTAGSEPNLWKFLTAPAAESSRYAPPPPRLVSEKAARNNAAIGDWFSNTLLPGLESFGKSFLPTSVTGRPRRYEHGTDAKAPIPAGQVSMVGEDGYELTWTNPVTGETEVIPHDIAKLLVDREGNPKDETADKTEGYDEGTASWGGMAPVIAGDPGVMGRYDTADPMASAFARMHNDIFQNPAQFVGYGGVGPFTNAERAVNQWGRPVGESMMAGSKSAIENAAALKQLTGRVSPGFFQSLLSKIPGFADGTWGATAAINAFNGGDQSALNNFNVNPAGYGTAAAPMGAPAGSGGDRAAYDARVAGLKQGIYKDFNFMDYNTAHGLDAYGRPIPELQYGYQPPARTSSGVPSTPRTPQMAGVDFGKLLKGMFPNSDLVTQAQLVAAADAALPPALRDVLAGKMPAPSRLPFEAPTARQLSTLAPDELQALGSYTGLKYNTPGGVLADTVTRMFRSPQASRAMVTAGGL